MGAKRAEISADLTWDTSSLFSDRVAWEQAYATLKNKIQAFSGWAGTLPQGPARIATFLEEDEKLSVLVDDLYTWVHLKHDENTADTQFKESLSRAENLAADFSEKTAFFEPEFLSLTQAEAWLESEELKPWKVLLQKTLKRKAHVLQQAQEELLSALSPVLGMSDDIYRAFSDTDLKFDSFTTADGQQHELSHGNLYGLLINPDREVRRMAFENTFRSYGNWPTLLSSTLQGCVKRHVVLAKQRKYQSSLQQALQPKAIDESVYHQLLSGLRDNLDAHHRYLDLRKKILGVEELEFYDLYLPMTSRSEKLYTPDESKQLLLKSIEPLGSAYGNEVRQGLSEGWIDWMECEAKRSGAYSSGSWQSKPYILMNFDGNLNDVFTLAHEMGHSMHSLRSNKNNSYSYSHYPIFLAEVASTFNEQLLLEHLKAKASDPKEKLYLINHEMEQIRTTFIRQTMFADFELAIHREEEEDRPLTSESLCEIYRNLLQTYFGGRVRISDGILHEWSRIPHFYYNFYVYQYATGIAAAFTLADRVLKGGSAELNDYLNILASGCTRDPIETLQSAGADMTRPDVASSVMKRLHQLLDEYEALIEDIK